MSQFGGNTADALAAYNAGPGAVEQYGGSRRTPKRELRLESARLRRKLPPVPPHDRHRSTRMNVALAVRRRRRHPPRPSRPPGLHPGHRLHRVRRPSTARSPNTGPGPHLRKAKITQASKRATVNARSRATANALVAGRRGLARAKARAPSPCPASARAGYRHDRRVSLRRAPTRLAPAGLRRAPLRQPAPARPAGATAKAVELAAERHADGNPTASSGAAAEVASASPAWRPALQLGLSRPASVGSADVEFVGDRRER